MERGGSSGIISGGLCMLCRKESASDSYYMWVGSRPSDRCLHDPSCWYRPSGISLANYHLMEKGGHAFNTHDKRFGESGLERKGFARCIRPDQ